MGNGERRLVDNFWDLRDHAHDHPDRWQGVTAEDIFQRLAEYTEAAEERGDPIDWRRDVTDLLIAWRVTEGDG
ncbi:MAG TPA: hypothetical protein VNA14_04640 [Mycobacteriales bacterium]|nr:hypothetical protein [Mycobacteriales bacterium]